MIAAGLLPVHPILYAHEHQPVAPLLAVTACLYVTQPPTGLGGSVTSMQ